MTGARPPTAQSKVSPSKPKEVVPPVPVGCPSEGKDNSVISTGAASPPKRPLPVPPVVTVTTTTHVTGAVAKTTTPPGISNPSPKRKCRPRSLTLTHIPVGPYKGIIAEQGVEGISSRGASRSLDEPERVTATRRQEAVVVVAPSASSTTLVDYGKRKEREWSGEWNVKDMEDVVRALRGLRVR